MLEILFSTNAANSLTLAAEESHGQTGPITAIRRNDIFALPLALSYGDISGQDRLFDLRQLCSFDPIEYRRQLNSRWKEVCTRIEALKERAQAGEDVRIYYSSEPDEACGLCWLLDRLHDWQCSGKVLLMSLPVCDCGESLCIHSGWGNVAPEEWGRILREHPAEPASRMVLTAAVICWHQLQAENAQLRAVMNGAIHSLPLEFYDLFIRQKLDALPQEFEESELIGQVLSLQLGIGDGFVALRIQEMIANGELTVTGQPKPGECEYRRTLYKSTPAAPEYGSWDMGAPGMF